MEQSRESWLPSFPCDASDGTPLCLFAGLAAFFGGVAILTWTHFHECQQPESCAWHLAAARWPQKPKGGLFFFFFLWELIPVASRVRNRTVSLGFLGLTPGNLAWPCCAFGQGPSLSPGVLFLCL